MPALSFMAPQWNFRMLEVKGRENFQKAASLDQVKLFGIVSLLLVQNWKHRLWKPQVSVSTLSICCQSCPISRSAIPIELLTQTPTNPSTLSFSIVGPLSCETGSRSRFVFCRRKSDGGNAAYHRSTPMRTLDNSVTGLSPTVNLNLGLSVAVFSAKHPIRSL